MQLGIRIEHQVGRFDVAMQNTQVVGMLDRFGGLDAQLGNRPKEPLIPVRTRCRAEIGFDLWPSIGINP